MIAIRPSPSLNMKKVVKDLKTNMMYLDKVSFIKDVFSNEKDIHVMYFEMGDEKYLKETSDEGTKGGL